MFSSSQHVNEVAAHQFENEDSLTETLDLMERLILPSVTLLSNTCYQDDKGAVEDVREKWCSFLGQEVSGKFKPIFHQKTGLRWVPDANEIYTKNMKCTCSTQKCCVGTQRNLYSTGNF